MPGHDIIVIGGSAGGVEALANLVSSLPGDLPAAVLVVIHFPPEGRSVLPQILSRSGRLPTAHAMDGEPILPGRIYVAPPDQHLLVRAGYVRLARGPRENGERPAIDALFRSAARAYGRRVVGVVLSGMLDDGTAGLLAIKMRGGVAIAQAPTEALFPSMPRSAIEHVGVDYVLPVARIETELKRLAHEPIREPIENGASRNMSDEIEKEAELAELDTSAVQSDERQGKPSAFSCPECGGVLWELRESELVRFRCRVGHGFSLDGLVAEQGEALEGALWAAYRALEERAALVRRIAASSRQRNHIHAARRFAEQAHEVEQQAALIRQVLLSGQGEAVNDAEEAKEEMAEEGSRNLAGE